MTFPAVAAVASIDEGSLDGAGGTAQTHPTGSTTGNLVIHGVSMSSPGGGGTVNGSAGWDRLANEIVGTSQGVLAIFARVLDGTGNDTLTLTNSIAATRDYVGGSLRITDHDVTNPATDITVGTVGTGSSTSANPGNCNPGGALDYLWAAFAAIAGASGTSFTGDPASYTPQFDLTHSTAGEGVACATRQLNAASEDAGAFTHTNRPWVALTLAIPGASETLPGVEGFVDAETVSIGSEPAVAISIGDEFAVFSLADDPPPPGGEDIVYDTFGVRTQEGNINATFDAFIAELGRTPNFFRHTVSHTSQSTASSNLWATFTNAAQAQFGYLWKHPTVTSSCTLPLIHGTGMSVAERNALLASTASGGEDAWWDSAFFDRVEQAPPGFQHRFCLAWEPELSWAHNFRDIDIEVWKAAFEHVAGRIQTAGHLVVYSGDGPWLNPNPSPPYGPVPGGGYWWEYGLPDLASFDLFGCDLYWGDDSPTVPYGRFSQCQEVAYSLGKPVCFPEYGVDRDPATSYTKSDAEVIAWFTDVWDLMATFPEDGPGSLDHHCLWNTSKAGAGNWVLTPAVLEVVVDRFGA